MADLTGGTSTWASGTADTASTLVDGVDQKKAQHVNGPNAGVLGLQSKLGAAATLLGGYADLATRLANTIPSGTIMLFVQTAAPVGWTKSVTHNDKALRVVSGSVSTGGSVAFTTALAAGTLTFTSDSHTLTTAESAAHTHNQDSSQGNLFAYNGSAGSVHWLAPNSTTNSSTTRLTTESSGGGGGHTHGITGPSLAVQYVDVIIATKD